VARRGRRLPRHDEGSDARARRSTAERGVRGRVDAAARAHRRPSPVVGAVVRRQRRAGRHPRAVVRPAAYAPSHAALEPQPRRRAAQRVAERGGDARVGERLRLLGRLERARQGPAPRDARCAAALGASAHARRVDAARGALRRPARRRLVLARGRRGALGAREPYDHAVRGERLARRAAGAARDPAARALRRHARGCRGLRRRLERVPGTEDGAQRDAARSRRLGAGGLRPR